MDLESAYREDIQNREKEKAGVINELDDSKEYIRVLTEEIENNKRRLETARNELYSREREMEEIEKRAKKKNIIIFIALAELLLIGLLGFLLIKADNRETVADIPASGETAEENKDTVEAPEIKTRKLSENLSDLIVKIRADETAPFVASVTRVEGFEYLAFSYGNLRVLYRNEFLQDDYSAPMEMRIENGSRSLLLYRKYDLSGNLLNLCPEIGNYLGNGREQLLFADRKESALPESLEFFDTELLWNYKALNLKEEIISSFTENYTTERPADVSSDISLPEKSAFMVLGFKDIFYNYLINENDYTNAVYNGEGLLNISEESEITIQKDNISFVGVLKMDEDRYIGEVTGKIGFSAEGPEISELKFGAFAYADQEDPDKLRVIAPYPEYIKDRVTILGYSGERFIIKKYEKAALNEYDFSKLNSDDSNNFYLADEAGNPITIKGIDVSKYQGNINWDKVKGDGVEYAIIRLGYRGMNEGTLETDPYYVKNITGANAAGVKAGIYFFSQALNEKEAVEEAEFVLNNIKDYNITYPIVFDTERVTTYDARANRLSRADRTATARAFCDRIREAGYTPMIYANTKYMTMGIDLDQLTDIDMWFAYYGTTVTFPYNFTIWQYTESGKVSGISSAVDINISFVDYSGN